MARANYSFSVRDRTMMDWIDKKISNGNLSEYIQGMMRDDMERHTNPDIPKLQQDTEECYEKVTNMMDRIESNKKTIKELIVKEKIRQKEIEMASNKNDDRSKVKDKFIIQIVERDKELAKEWLALSDNVGLTAKAGEFIGKYKKKGIHVTMERLKEYRKIKGGK